MAKGWEAGFKSAVKQNRVGWNVYNNNGTMILMLCWKDIQTQNINLPYECDPINQGDALLLINRIYGLVLDGDLTLKKALQESRKESSKPSRRLKKI